MLMVSEAQLSVCANETKKFFKYFTRMMTTLVSSQKSDPTR